ncbi:MAG: TonB-dependent receptor [Verrucomicrobiota bacterium]|nr:TonB-dependent receptor [Verrucomicrobiota bacterium]
MLNKKRDRVNLILLGSFASFALIVSNAGAQDEGATEALDPSLVIGGGDTFDLPGSGYVIDMGELRSQNYYNINRILDRIPGVYLREETGNGNFPNISIRGGDGTRSDNVTIMEVGILTAPAAYSAPSAYYSPNPARMSGIEILKGSSQIAFGPHTTGGVVNYLSTQFPTDHNFYLRSTYGSNSAFDVHSYWSDTSEGEFGNVGVLAEIYYRSTDGFREIGAGNGYGGSDSTGFELMEPMIKLFWEPNSDVYQRLEFKYGYTDFDADETYVGLTESDLKANPYKRYAGTFLDHMATEHHRSYLKWLVEPTDDLSFQVAAYYNKFERDWYKIRKAGGQSIYKVLSDPVGYAAAFDDLRLLGTGSLGIRHNARSYESSGLQFNVNYDTTIAEIEHSISAGFRFHNDSIRRFQQDDTIDLSGGAPVVNAGVPGSGGNRAQEADAWAVWIQDDIDLGKLTVSPGIRYETIDGDWTDYNSDPTNTRKSGATGETDAVAPGVGMTYKLSDTTNLFGGIYKGISSPSPRGFLKSGTRWEESIGYEIGTRTQKDGMSTEIAGFFTDYDELVGSNAGLGGVALDDGLDGTNAGAAEVYGIEFLQAYEAGADNAVSIPRFVSATYTSATLDNALSKGSGDDIFAGGVAGADIPYIPEWKLSIGAGLSAENWGLNAVGSYHSDAYGTAVNSEVPTANARQGKIDGGFILDLSAHYKLSDTTRIIGGVHNVLDEVLTVSRLPEGPRVNAPREFYIGFELQW